jgi:hypothetical protein
VVVTSPTVRCLATVLGVARWSGTDVAVDRRLLPGAGPLAADVARPLLSGEATVLCTHGEVIPALLRELGVDLDLEPGVEVDLTDQAVGIPCEKGSVWEIGPGLRGRYHTPDAIAGATLLRTATR